MDDMLAAVAPEAEKLEIDFTDSFAEVTIEDDTVVSLRISCGGSVKVLLTSASGGYHLCGRGNARGAGQRFKCAPINRIIK